MKAKQYRYKDRFVLSVKREEHGTGYIIMSQCITDSRKSRRFNSNLYDSFKHAQENLDGMARALHLQEVSR